MQTLPFIVSKPSTSTVPVETEASKSTEIKGAPFTQMLSQQMAQEDAKKALTKVNNELARANTQKKNADKTAIDNRTNANSLNENGVDAQWLASALAAKTGQEVTDGKVLLDTSQTDANAIADMPIAIANLQPAVITPAVSPVLAQDTPVAIATDGKAAIATPALHDGNLLAHRVDNTASKASINDASAQQKITELSEHQQPEQNQLVQAMVVESKLKNESDTMMSKAMLGMTEATTITTVSLHQPSAKFSASAIPTAGDNSINAYPGKTGWNEAVSQKVVWMVGATEQSAKLTLNPPELGPLEVIIQVNHEKADATFISENPVVRKALEEGISTLRQLMGEAGVELGQANVNTSKQQQASQQSHREQIARQHMNDVNAHIETDSTSKPNMVRQTNGLVDIFA